MALKPMNPGAVSTATVVSDLPDMPQDLADKTAVAKWWFDTRLVFQRLLSGIERRRNVGGTEPATEYSPTWDSITGKPDKFPPEDHSHVAGKATPLVQVVAEDPLVAGTTDPDTGNADIGFYEQTAATFLAGPVIGPPQPPVFRPILLSDLPAAVRDMPTGGDPGTYDDLNGTTGGDTPEGIVAVQARGGAWSLAGIPAWDGSPRRFGLNTWSGALVYSGDGCSTTTTYSGAGSYHPSTGATASTLTRHISQGGCLSGTEYTYYAYDTPLLTYVSATTNAVTATAIVCTAVASPGYGASGSGVARADLSDEDTPDSAIARMLATAEWGGANTAIRTVPATGITGLYREARYRTEHTAGDPAVTSPTLIGLVPWQRYQLTVALESRPVDEAGTPTGDWAESGTRTHYILANLDGEGGIDWQVVEPTDGYETRIASTLVEAV